MNISAAKDIHYIKESLGFEVLSHTSKLDIPVNNIVIDKVNFINYKGLLINYGTFFYLGAKYLLFNNRYYRINWL